MRAFVTGATGLLGSNIVSELKERARRVTALVRRLEAEQSIDAHEKDLATALASSAADSARFRLLGFGEGWDVPPLEEVNQSTSVGECP